MGGTSMSAPLVAGCAALVRQYYLDELGHSPSAALLKATLINSTNWLPGDDAIADHGHLPNFHQGFGALNMTKAIPNRGAPAMKLVFHDPWQEAQEHFVRSGQAHKFNFRVSGGEELRVCMAWTDLPGRGLQNNLNLFLEHTPTRKKWVGNDKLPLAITQPDPDNNVEVIRIEDPPPGEYRVQVTAANLLRTGQDYALVIMGGIDSHLVKV
jgi:hypothetical protein